MSKIMKFNKYALVLLILSLTFSFALAKEIKETNIKITAQCEMCKDRIEKHLNKIDGIEFVNLNVENAICTVKYDPEEIELDDIRKEIASVGYDADDVKASKRAYRKLPKCCKVPGKK